MIKNSILFLRGDEAPDVAALFDRYAQALVDWGYEIIRVDSVAELARRDANMNQAEKEKVVAALIPHKIPIGDVDRQGIESFCYSSPEQASLSWAVSRVVPGAITIHVDFAKSGRAGRARKNGTDEALNCSVDSGWFKKPVRFAGDVVRIIRNPVFKIAIF